MALDAGVGLIAIDNFDDIDRLERLLRRSAIGERQAVLMRVTPDVRGDTHEKISTGQADSKFGFSIAEARRRRSSACRASRAELVGLHFHIGSQLLELEPFAPRSRRSPSSATSPSTTSAAGLGVAYTAEQQPPAIEDYVGDRRRRARAARPGKRLLIEPGRRWSPTPA
jgi:diaminopimelate decarboxylase